MKIWHISDTHGYHEKLNVPDCDMVIHSGDASNERNPNYNLKEIENFLSWYSSLNIKNKIFIPGNHDTSIYHKLITKERFNDLGIHMLIDEMNTIDGLNIYGSPWSPEFGNGWAWNKSKKSLNKYWQVLKNKLEDTHIDILVTHGPPMSILDLSYRENKKEIEQCGDKPLFNFIMDKKPKLSLFGHIHDHGSDLKNNGIYRREDIYTTFSNASIVNNNNYYTFNKGNIIEFK